MISLEFNRLENKIKVEITQVFEIVLQCCVPEQTSDWFRVQSPTEHTS